MVLIGTRRDSETGKQWCLLQNWWPSMQFVEVSEEYLKRCQAVVHFVTTPQTEISQLFPTSKWRIAEFVDKPDAPVLDGRVPPPDCIYDRNVANWAIKSW